MISAYFVTFSTLSLMQHWAFYTANDLGVFNQKLYNTLHGRFFLSPETNGGQYAHMDYLILSFLPIYVFFPYAETLLVLQSAVLAAAALPLYLLATKRLKDRRAACLIAATYLVYPALHYLNLYDYHSTIMAVPLLITGFWLFDSGRFRLSLLSFAMAMLADETVSIFVMLSSLYFLLSKERKWALRLGLFAATWFVIEMMIILPNDLVSGGPYFDIYRSRYDHLGSTQWDVMTSIATNPVAALTYGGIESRTTYAFQMLAPLGFLSLLDPAILISTPQVAANFFSKYDWMRNITQSYTPLIIPFAFMSAVFGMQRLSRRFKKLTPRRLSVFMLACCLASFFSFGLGNMQIAKGFAERMVQDQELTLAVQETALAIPENATVSAPYHILPHMQGKDRIYRQPRSLEEIIRDAQDLGPLGYVIIDFSPKRRPDVNETEAERMFNAAGYSLAFNRSTVFLYKHDG